MHERNQTQLEGKEKIVVAIAEIVRLNTSKDSPFQVGIVGYESSIVFYVSSCMIML